MHCCAALQLIQQLIIQKVFRALSSSMIFRLRIQKEKMNSGMQRTGCNYIILQEDTLQLEEGKWFLTDDTGAPQKFELPELTIEPYGSLIIWCDNLNTEGDEIHTNFKISS